MSTLRPRATVEGVGASRAPAGAGPVPAPVVWVERICYMLVIAGFVLNARGRATTGAQSLFRLSLFGVGLVGLLLVFVVKMIRKARSV